MKKILVALVLVFPFCLSASFNPYVSEIKFYAEKYDVNFYEMQYIVYCESKFRSNVQSEYIQPYGREESYGLVQIHLRAHPSITREQAEDPHFALDFLAKHISEGRGEQMWTNCYKQWYNLGK